MLSLHQFHDLSQGDGDCVKTICIAELRSAMLLFSLFLQLKVPTRGRQYTFDTVLMALPKIVAINILNKKKAT